MGTSAAPPVTLRVKNVRYCRVCLSRVEAGERVPAVCPSCRWPGSWFTPVEMHQATHSGQPFLPKKAPSIEVLQRAVWGSGQRYAATHDGVGWWRYELGRFGPPESQVGLGLMADGTRFELTTIDPSGPAVRRTTIPIGELLLARVVVQTDEETITTATTESANRGSTLGRAAVGGILLGGAGAVVGALSAGAKRAAQTSSQTTSSTIMKHIFLELHIEDRQSSVHRVEFFKGVWGQTLGESEEIIGQAHAWVERLQRAMNKANAGNRNNEA